MIAITGASGNLGTATIQCLLNTVAPADIVAVVRNPESVDEFNKRGVLIRQADYSDYSSLKRAFTDVEKVLQISTIGVSIKEARQQEQNVVNAVVENNVGHIIYTSMLQARMGTVFQGTQIQYHTEELIRQTAIPYTFFRNSLYMEAIPELIGDALQSKQIRHPAGDGRVSFVSRTDIAQALARVLAEDGHEMNVYEITGSRSYSFAELAALISQEKGINMRHADITAEQFRRELMHYKLPLEVVDLLVSMADAIKIGEFSYVDNQLQELLGRTPIQLEEYVKELLL